VLQVLQDQHVLTVLQDFILMELEDVFHVQLVLMPIVEPAQASQLALFALQDTLVPPALVVHLDTTLLQVANHAPV
jgi:hypothetical protein